MRNSRRSRRRAGLVPVLREARDSLIESQGGKNDAGEFKLTNPGGVTGDRAFAHLAAGDLARFA